MAVELDYQRVATFASVSEATLTSIIDNPTRGTVLSLLQGIQNNIKECEQTRSQKTRLEVEFETVVRTNESKVKVLQNSRDRVLADVDKLRQDLQTAESNRTRAEADLENFRQSVQADATESATLRARIQSVEITHQDTLSLLDSKTATVERLSQDLKDEHQKLVEARRQVTSLEQAKQEANSALTTARFRQATLEQEIELQRKSLDWHDNERKLKNEEHQKFRKEKNAKLSELQRSIDGYKDEIDGLRRQEATLKKDIVQQAVANEDLAAKFQRLTEEKIAEAENYRIEVDNLNRLVELQKAAANTAKARVQELTTALDESKDDAAEEIGIIRAEIEDEHRARISAEQEIARLEARVTELEAQIQSVPSRPGTPRQAANGLGPSTPVRSGTPLASAFTPKSAYRSKGGLTTTQLYSEYTKLENDLRSERRQREKLQVELETVFNDLQAHAPEVEELRAENNRLQAENTEVSVLNEELKQQRDSTLKQVRVSQAQLNALKKDLSEAQQMVRDRTSQLRRLLLEQQVGAVSDAEYQRMSAEIAEVEAAEANHLTQTQRSINEHLLVFKNINELLEINERHLLTSRNLAAQFESQQRQELEREHDDLKKRFAELQAKLQDYKDEISHMVAQKDSFVRERDMFKSMVTRRRGTLGTSQGDPIDFARSMPAGSLPNFMNDAEHDYAKLLRDQQAQMDNYRSDYNADRDAYKKQISELTARCTAVQAEASRNFSQLTTVTQQFEMLQASLSHLKTENAELQKRSYANMENATKQELKTQQAAEELIELKGTLDSLRRDCANLKAEKDLWKSVEKRLIDDNEVLRNERSRLDQLNASLQSLLNEREHSDNEVRRRLQTQVDDLEVEVQNTKRKLDEQVEDNKNASQRRGYELEQSQKRLDDLMTSLSTTREELAAVKTARDYLQARFDEMGIELRAAEEKLEVFTRSTTAPELGESNESVLSREQELSFEVSELRRDLDLKSSELARAEEQVEDYKNIAQAAEERLQEFMETNEEDKKDLEAASIEKDKRLEDLQQRIGDITTELGSTNSELSRIRDEQSEAARVLEEQKALLQAEVDHLKQSEEKAREQAQFNLESSKIQAGIAQDAQASYDAELVRHGQAREELMKVKAELNERSLQMVQLRTQVQTLQADSHQREDSWAQIEGRLRAEILEAQSRREEVIKQNSILHSQLETFTQQVAAVQAERAQVSGAGEGTSSNTPDLGSLQEVISYLRREKEIVEVQFQLSQNDVKRLKAQYDVTQSQLEEVRLKLDQQRSAGLDLERSNVEHRKLVESLEQLQLMRESNTTLRAELKQSQQALSEKTQQVEELNDRIPPLQARVDELEHLLELRQGEMELLQRDRDSWQQRTQHILTKYDRADPAELEALREKISSLESERDEAIMTRDELTAARDEAVQARDALQSEIEGHPAAVEAAKNALKDRLTEQFKGRSREMSAKVREKQAEVDAVESAKAELQSELESLRQQLNDANNVVPQETSSSSVTALDEAERTQLQQRIAALEIEVTDKDAQLSTIQGDYKIKENGMKDILNRRLAEVKKEAEAAKMSALAELKSSLDAQHQEELELAKSQASLTTSSAQADAQQIQEDGQNNESGLRGSFEEWAASITEAQARVLVQTNTTISNIVKTNIRKRVEREQEQLRQQISEAQPSATADEVSGQLAEIEKRFASEKAAIIAEKEQEFAIEKDALIKEHRAVLEAEKQTLLNQQQQRIEEEVAKAKSSTEKMLSMKISMVQKQNAGNLAKLSIVKQAAEETPDKPVVEVWNIAKTAKAPAMDAPKVSGSVPPTAASIPAPVTISTTAEPKTEEVPVMNGTSAAPSEGEVEELEENQDGQPQTAVPVGSARSGLPQPRGRGNFRGQRGAAAGGQGRGSGIPVPGSTNFAARARGRGASRGAPSPTRGGFLNPAAAQFTPGKRGREDSVDDGNTGKRIRGGGAGS